MFTESDHENILCRVNECRRGIANARARGDRETEAYFVNHIGDQRRWLARWQAWAAEVRAP